MTGIDPQWAAVVTTFQDLVHTIKKANTADPAPSPAPAPTPGQPTARAVVVVTPNGRYESDSPAFAKAVEYAATGSPTAIFSLDNLKWLVLAIGVLWSIIHPPTPVPVPVPVVPGPVDPTPKPPAPVPPTPVPVPPIPVPVPPVPPVPTPTDKLRVVMVYESSGAYTREQLNTLNSATIRQYLSSRCMDDGGRPAWRAWDKDVDVTKETATWQAAWAKAKADTAALPKFVIFAGDQMTSVPFPATEKDALTLLQKYGGL